MSDPIDPTRQRLSSQYEGSVYTAGYDKKEAEFCVVLEIPSDSSPRKEEIDGFIVEWQSEPEGEDTVTVSLTVHKPEHAPFFTSWSFERDLPPFMMPQPYWKGHIMDWPFVRRIRGVKVKDGDPIRNRLLIWEA